MAKLMQFLFLITTTVDTAVNNLLGRSGSDRPSNLEMPAVQYLEQAWSEFVRMISAGRQLPFAKRFN